MATGRIDVDKLRDKSSTYGWYTQVLALRGAQTTLHHKQYYSLPPFSIDCKPNCPVAKGHRLPLIPASCGWLGHRHHASTRAEP